MTWLYRSMKKLSVTRTATYLGDTTNIVAAKIE